MSINDKIPDSHEPELRDGIIKLPGGRGTTTPDDPAVDVDNGVYVDENGCPECGSDLELCLIHHTEPRGIHPTPEWEAVAEICSEYDNDCTHRKP